MSRPEESCHPERLLEGARTVVSAALCYYADAPEPAPGEGRLPRYAWRDGYAELREKLDSLGRRLGGDYRVLVDENQHVDREAAARAGVGFYGKNTLLITRRFGSWVVLGTLVTTAEVEPSPPLGLDCGSCRLCVDACPTGALDEPGTLDATRCLSYWTQTANDVPEPYREELGASVYGCDICQDVCPWNRGVEKRRAGTPLPGGAEANVSLVDWLERDADELADDYSRLFVPRKDGRYLKRNALVALGNAGRPRGSSDRRAPSDRRGPAAARVRRMGVRAARRTGRRRVSRRSLLETERWVAWVRVGAFAFALLQVVLLGDEYPSRTYEVVAWLTTGALGVGALVFLWLSRRDLSVRELRVGRVHGARLRRGGRRRVRARLLVRQRDADPSGRVHPDRGGGASLRHPRRRPPLARVPAGARGVRAAAARTVSTVRSISTTSSSRSGFSSSPA